MQVEPNSLKPRGNLIDIINRLSNDKENHLMDELQTLVKKDEEHTGRELPGLLDDLMVIPMYMMTLTPKMAGFTERVILITEEHSGLYNGPIGPLQLSNPRLLNEWDYLLTYQIMSNNKMSDAKILSHIFYLITMPGWPEKFVKWRIANYKGGDDEDEDEDEKEEAKNEDEKEEVKNEDEKEEVKNEDVSVGNYMTLPIIIENVI